MSKGHPFFCAASPSLEIGLARSGVKGPLTSGSSCIMGKNTCSFNHDTS